MEAIWKVFADCKSEEAALKLASRSFLLVGQAPESLTSEPYAKGGYVIRAITRLPVQEWSQIVLLALSQAQAVGREWVIYGDIREELEAWSNHAAVSGVTSVHLQVLCGPNCSFKRTDQSLRD